MVTLATAGLRFDSIMQTDAGFPFRGTIEPLAEGRISNQDLANPRFILRVQRDCPIVTGAIIADPAGRRFLLADQDTSFAYNQIEYRSHRLFMMTQKVKWERETTISDTLTGLAKGIGRALVDDVWCLIERNQREFADTTMRVKEEVRQVITGAELKLGDMLDDSVVKRIDPYLGVWIAEIQ